MKILDKDLSRERELVHKYFANGYPLTNKTFNTGFVSFIDKNKNKIEYEGRIYQPNKEYKR